MRDRNDPMEEAIDDFLTPPEAKDRSFSRDPIVFCTVCGDHFLLPEEMDEDNPPRYKCKPCNEIMRVGSFRDWVENERKYGRR